MRIVKRLIRLGSALVELRRVREGLETRQCQAYLSTLSDDELDRLEMALLAGQGDVEGVMTVEDIMRLSPEEMQQRYRELCRATPDAAPFRLFGGRSESAVEPSPTCQARNLSKRESAEQ